MPMPAPQMLATRLTVASILRLTALMPIPAQRTVVMYQQDAFTIRFQTALTPAQM